jgi:phycoerythrobilin:ferredoxin oxidoreductase
VIFPELNYDLPFFGADLVTLPGGHLIALDMQPLFHDAAYQKKYSDPILPIFQSYQQDLPWGGDFPEEAKPFFSPAFLWTRPQKTEVVQTQVFEAFKEYLSAYLDFVDRAEPVTDSQQLEAIEQAQLRYIGYRAAKDPARGMFARLYGPEWTEEYIHGFLFDLERELAKR